MPSRIDIGPEGGPFVAINENSNDLELQDINGNVIAVWDETAGQWDLNNNSLTNIDAIDANEVSTNGVNRASDIPDGSTVYFINALDANGGHGVVILSQRTTGVSTTETAILGIEPDGNVNRGSLKATVFGKDGSGNRFCDDVSLLINFGSITVTNSEEQNAPANRSYSFGSGTLKLTMGSGTYTIQSSGLLNSETTI